MYARIEHMREEKPFYVLDVFAALVVLAAIILFAVFAARSERGETVEIYVDGKLYGSYPLDEDRTIEIARDGKRNVVEIRNGEVLFAEASCRNKSCVRAGPVSEAGQQIVCLPNGVSAVIRGEDEIDATTGCA